MDLTYKITYMHPHDHHSSFLPRRALHSLLRWTHVALWLLATTISAAVDGTRRAAASWGKKLSWICVMLRIPPGPTLHHSTHSSMGQPWLCKRNIDSPFPEVRSQNLVAKDRSTGSCLLQHQPEQKLLVAVKKTQRQFFSAF